MRGRLMLPLFDLMMQAQNGKGMEALARQFNLAQDQAATAVAALMPAFSAGFKRQSGNPFDFASLMQQAASGNYASYFEDLARTFTPQGMADGQAALSQIFGSQDVTRAVAEQASKFTGLGQDVLKQMMPALADTIMGGLIKQMTGQMGKPAANPFMPETMAALQQQWMQTMGLAPKKADPLAEQMKAMFDNPFTKAMQDMFTPKAAANQDTGSRPEAADPFSLNPFMKSFQEMMSSGMGAAAPASGKGATEDARAATPDEPYKTFVNSVFDSGLEVQKSYQAGLDAIFEQWKPKG